MNGEKKGKEERGQMMMVMGSDEGEKVMVEVMIRLTVVGEMMMENGAGKVKQTIMVMVVSSEERGKG